MSTGTTPRGAAPEHERRKALVREAMATLEGTEELDTRARLERLDQIQSVLAGVLADQPMRQDRLPGLPRQP